VLHVSDCRLPALSVPSVHMTAVRSGPVAVPDLCHLWGACLEGGEATFHQTRLAFHKPTLPLAPINFVEPRPTAVLQRSSRQPLPRPARPDRHITRQARLALTRVTDLCASSTVASRTPYLSMGARP
jgi:hypothetical protein